MGGGASVGAGQLRRDGLKQLDSAERSSCQHHLALLKARAAAACCRIPDIVARGLLGECAR